MMQKTKTPVTPNKCKSKINLPSPTPKKSLGKSKDKPSCPSPRNTRIHTLETKTNIEVNRKLQIRIETENILSPSASTTNKEPYKGYETPKFKCET